MKTLRILPAAIIACFTFAVSAHADVFNLDLLGKAGAGLLSGNENGTILGTPGSGGELGSGISYNDATNALTLNIGWGSGNGFTNLTGDAIAGHIHGPTASGGTASFTENAPVWVPLDSLPEWDPSATMGGFDGTVTLTDEQEVAFFEGKLYVNVHTDMNSGGEIRGNLVIPEPTTMSFLALGVATGALLFRRRR